MAAGIAPPPSRSVAPQTVTSDNLESNISRENFIAYLMVYKNMDLLRSAIGSFVHIEIDPLIA